jgi:chromosome segregation ATPase
MDNETEILSILKALVKEIADMRKETFTIRETLDEHTRTLDEHTDLLELLVRGLRMLEKNQVTDNRLLRKHSEMLQTIVSQLVDCDERITRLERA